ncbi:MAG: nitrite reductase (NAD(P)H), partial [Steroidobacteraceae bacterium]
MIERTRIVVVGNGMVGQRFLEKLPAAHSFDITVLCEEPRPAYDRVQLSCLFAGKSAQDLNLVPPGFFETHRIGVRLGERAVAIDAQAHT